MIGPDLAQRKIAIGLSFAHFAHAVFTKMLSWLSGIFKDSDNQPNWARIGAVIHTVASGAWAVITFVVEHKAGHEQGPNKEQIEQIQKPLAEQLAAQNALIANLTKALLEKNPSAASGPGAQQVLGAAVKSIAQGAEEGDPRLKQAFGLLEENKIAEATQLLKAVAEDKTAHAEQETAQASKDRKEAAITTATSAPSLGLATRSGRWRLMRKPSRSIRTTQRACIGPERFRLITAILPKRKPASSAC